MHILLTFPSSFSIMPWDLSRTILKDKEDNLLWKMTTKKPRRNCSRNVLKKKEVNFTPTYRSGGFRIQCYLSPSFILLFDTGNPVRLYSLTPVFHPGFSSLSLHLKQHVPPYFCFFCHSDVFGRVPLRGLFHPAIPGSRKERSGVPLPQCSLLR